MTSGPPVILLTGRLAEPALRRVMDELVSKLPLQYEIVTLGIQVAALMHVDWILRRLPQLPLAWATRTESGNSAVSSVDVLSPTAMPQPSTGSNSPRVIVPGWCQGDLDKLSAAWKVPVERGPKDLQDLPEYLGRANGRTPPDLTSWSIEILAEINHAPRLSDRELMEVATGYRNDGADLIDLGCIPGESWATVGSTVRRLRNEGFRVSIDSFEQREVTAAVEAGAELILSGNSSNVSWVKSLPAELVIIPDQPAEWDRWTDVIAEVTAAGQKFRLDPVLEPIGYGFAASLARYMSVRTAFPDTPIMMGIGNVTELTEVDSSGVNLLLAAICEELQIGSVLTTQVIPWCQTAVREFNLSRRIVRHSLSQRVLPKHLTSDLLLLRDRRRKPRSAADLKELAGQLTDANFRIFAEAGEVHLMNRYGYWHGSDPYTVFDEMSAANPDLSADHAFYLGIELSKARTALTLGKNYVQDEALRWGFLTLEETSALHRREELRQHRAALTKPDEAAAEPQDSGTDGLSSTGIPI